MYELVRGPLALAAFFIFLFGLLFQTVRFYRLTKPVRSSPAYKPQPRSDGTRHSLPSVQRRAWKQRTVLGMEPGMVVVTAVFHAGLILTPLTLLSHSLLIQQSWGVRLPAFPESLSDLMTLLVIGLGCYLLYRRVVLDRARSITGPMDIVLLAVVLAPFLTGFLAYHQWLSYRPMIIAHILSGELMLVCIPFTRLAHVLFFFLTRLGVGSEFSFVRGSRDWR